MSLVVIHTNAGETREGVMKSLDYYENYESGLGGVCTMSGKCKPGAKMFLALMTGDLYDELVKDGYTGGNHADFNVTRYDQKYIEDRSNITTEESTNLFVTFTSEARDGSKFEEILNGIMKNISSIGLFSESTFTIEVRDNANHNKMSAYIIFSKPIELRESVLAMIFIRNCTMNLGEKLICHRLRKEYIKPNVAHYQRRTKVQPKYEVPARHNVRPFGGSEDVCLPTTTNWAGKTKIENTKTVEDSMQFPLLSAAVKPKPTEYSKPKRSAISTFDGVKQAGVIDNGSFQNIGNEPAAEAVKIPLATGLPVKGTIMAVPHIRKYLDYKSSGKLKQVQKERIVDVSLSSISSETRTNPWTLNHENLSIEIYKMFKREHVTDILVDPSIFQKEVDNDSWISVYDGEDGGPSKEELTEVSGIYRHSYVSSEKVMIVEVL